MRCNEDKQLLLHVDLFTKSNPSGFYVNMVKMFMSYVLFNDMKCSLTSRILNVNGCLKEFFGFRVYSDKELSELLSFAEFYKVQVFLIPEPGIKDYTFVDHLSSQYPIYNSLDGESCEHGEKKVIWAQIPGIPNTMRWPVKVVDFPLVYCNSDNAWLRLKGKFRVQAFEGFPNSMDKWISAAEKALKRKPDTLTSFKEDVEWALKLILQDSVTRDGNKSEGHLEIDVSPDGHQELDVSPDGHQELDVSPDGHQELHVGQDCNKSVCHQELDVCADGNKPDGHQEIDVSSDGHQETNVKPGVARDGNKSEGHLEIDVSPDGHQELDVSPDGHQELDVSPDGHQELHVGQDCNKSVCHQELDVCADGNKPDGHQEIDVSSDGHQETNVKPGVAKDSNKSEGHLEIDVSPDGHQELDVSPDGHQELHVSQDCNKSVCHQEIDVCADGNKPDGHQEIDVSSDGHQETDVKPGVARDGNKSEGHLEIDVSPDGHQELDVSPDGHQELDVSPDGHQELHVGQDCNKSVCHQELDVCADGNKPDGHQEIDVDVSSDGHQETDVKPGVGKDGNESEGHQEIDVSPDGNKSDCQEEVDVCADGNKSDNSHINPKCRRPITKRKQIFVSDSDDSDGPHVKHVNQDSHKPDASQFKTRRQRPIKKRKKIIASDSVGHVTNVNQNNNKFPQSSNLKKKKNIILSDSEGSDGHHMIESNQAKCSTPRRINNCIVSDTEDSDEEVKNMKRKCTVIVSDSESNHDSGRSDVFPLLSGKTEKPSIKPDLDDSDCSEVEGDHPKVVDSKNKNIYVSCAEKSLFTKDGKRKKTDRKYNARHMCPFCKVKKTNFSHHIMSKKHQEEEVVKKIMSTKDGVERKHLIDQLRLKSDHENNISVIKEKKGEIFLLRRLNVEGSDESNDDSDEDDTCKKFQVSNYGPCPTCFGWVLKKSLRRHFTSCTSSKSTECNWTNRALEVQSDIIAGNIPTEASQALINEVYPIMRGDEVSKVAKADDLIVNLGNQWLRRNRGNEVMRKYYTSTVMRLAAKLKIGCQKLSKTELDMSSYLTPKFFETVLRAAISCCHVNEEDEEELKAPSNAIKLGFDIKRMLSGKLSKAIIAEDEKEQKEAVDFKSLMEIEWGLRVTRLARSLLVERSYSKRNDLPRPSDVKKLFQYLKEELSKLDLKESTYTTYRRAVTLTLARLTLYNRRRCHEVQAMRLKSYSARTTGVDEIGLEIRKELTDFEHVLLTTQEVVVIRGKTGKGVPVILPGDVKEAMTYITNANIRSKAGIPEENKYVFGSTGVGVFRAYDAIREVAESPEAGLEMPDLVRTSNMRKYMATMLQAAIEFCMNFNTKINRKKLVKALFTVHRTRYDLLAFYARMVSTLYPCMPDVANDLVQLLKGDFRWHVRKKDQINIESKLKTVRFIGELVKFNLFPKAEALHCLKMLMFDFSHHNIEMACALLDNCGRFLYRSQDSHHRTKIYLDVMMRKKSALHLESRYTTMIENAFYYSNPPDVQQTARKVRPPMHEYIRKLLYKDLSKTTTEKVLRQMRKLKWDDPEIVFYATKCLISVWILRYNSIHCAANLLAGLAPYYEHVAIQVVDGVLEDIRLGMEVNHPKFNQRRVSCAKYMGELYNYRLVESSVVFKALYSFITFGVSYDEANPAPLDPPEHLFRIRLVCVLLETCGQYFDKGSSKKKLDCFLLYFQKYYLFKRKNPIYNEDRPFPIDINNLVQDTLETIRPKMKLSSDYEDACKAIEDLEKEVKPKIASVLPILETEDGNTSEADDSLCTIQETEETDDLSQTLSQLDMDDSGTSQEDNAHRGRYSQDNEGQYNESNEEYMSESAGEDYDGEVNLIAGVPKVIKCQEDDDFLSAFDKMMAENIQQRSQESLKVPQMDIAVPTQAKNKKYANYDEPKVDNSIEFMLMTRKGNKQQFTNINVPISDEFATKFKERTQAEKAEKEKMKQVVLGIHERQEEEDYQEMIASMNRTLPTLNTNRERRVRYQHPKGAPDADLIFGSKKR